MNDDYIAVSTVFPEWLIVTAEATTVFAFTWITWEVAKLTVFFWKDKSMLARLKTQEFFTDALTAALTILMGLFLFINWEEGVKGLVVIRPIVGVLNALALRRLYNHFRNQ
jgi:hypothetical protein